MTIFAQFVDDQIVQVFTSPQDPEYWPGILEIEDTDPRYLTYLNPCTISSLIIDIDRVADAAREAVAGDPLRAVEYDRAATQARAYIAAAYKGTVPPMVACWAINGRTNKQAADSIAAEADAYEGALVAIRAARLGAKEAIRALGNDKLDEAKEVAATVIAQIKQAVAGIGNAPVVVQSISADETDASSEE